MKGENENIVVGKRKQWRGREIINEKEKWRQTKRKEREGVGEGRRNDVKEIKEDGERKRMLERKVVRRRSGRVTKGMRVSREEESRKR